MSSADVFCRKYTLILPSPAIGTSIAAINERIRSNAAGLATMINLFVRSSGIIWVRVAGPALLDSAVGCAGGAGCPGAPVGGGVGGGVVIPPGVARAPGLAPPLASKSLVILSATSEAAA